MKRNKIKYNQQGVRQVVEKRYTSPSAINCVEDAVELIVNNFYDLDREAFFSINVDENNKPINFSINHIGALDKSLMHPREIFKTAILSKAKKIVLMHNHPSGSEKPSQADIDSTHLLIDGALILGLEVIEHYVFTPRKRYFSIFDKNIKSLNNTRQLELNFISEDTYSLDDVRIRQKVSLDGHEYEIENPDSVRDIINKEHGYVEEDQVLTFNLNKQAKTDNVSKHEVDNHKTINNLVGDVYTNAILNNSAMIIPVIRFSDDQGKYSKQLKFIEELMLAGEQLGIQVLDVFVFEKSESYTLRERMITNYELRNRFGDFFLNEENESMNKSEKFSQLTKLKNLNAKVEKVIGDKPLEKDLER